MIQQVYILGQIGRAVFEQDGRYFILGGSSHQGPVACRPGDISLLFDSGTEFSILPVSNINLEEIETKLESSKQAHRALSMILTAMDEELSPETRSLAVKAAEELMQFDTARAFVKARLLAHRLPETADINGAIKHAESAGATLVLSLYREVLKSQEAILIVLDEWNEVAPQLLESFEEQADAENTLIDAGIISEMVASVATQDSNRLNSAVLILSKNPGLNQALPRGPHIINALRLRLIERLKTDAKKTGSNPVEGQTDIETLKGEYTDSQETDAISDLIAEFDRRGRNWKRSKGYQVEERVRKQLEAIGKHIRRGDLSQANDFLYGLITFHLEHSEKEHVAMSLCSLSKIALDMNQFDMAETLIQYAVSLEVEDAVIGSTQAEVLKARGQFEAALTVYQEIISRFPDDVVARSGYAEVLKETGQFEAALTVYQEIISRFSDDVIARNGYAEVLKEMGQFEAALSAYEETMSRFPDNVVARSGYAEVLKDMGQFEAALSAYEETMSRFPDDVVAHTGYAEVLKARGQFEAALNVYRETIEYFPDDVVARSGYAEVLKEVGQFEAALTVYQEAMSRFPNDVVAHTGYAEVLKARGQFEAALTVYQEIISRFPDNVVARNGYASTLVVMNRFDDAQTFLSYLSKNKLFSRQDWIGYHILAMPYLKRGDIDEAIRRLEYGWGNVQWPDERAFFATALAVARIKKKEFAKALEPLSDNVVYLDVFQKQKRLALIGHSQAGLGEKSKAASTLAEITDTGNPHLVSLKDALVKRFGLAEAVTGNLQEADIEQLDKKIEEEEVYLAMAA